MPPAVLTPEARAKALFRGLSILDDASGVTIIRYLTDQIRAVEAAMLEHSPNCPSGEPAVCSCISRRAAGGTG